jgi:hypothetical protein
MELVNNMNELNETTTVRFINKPQNMNLQDLQLYTNNDELCLYF